MEATQDTSEPLVERRGLPRLKLSIPIQFRNILKPQEPFSGSLSKDISAGGVRFSGSTFLPKGARLVLLISLPPLLKPIRTLAQVVWVSEQRFSETYECGLQFIEVTPEDRDTIATYVERGVVTRRL